MLTIIFLVCFFLFLAPEGSCQDDMEKDFFSDMASMEQDYKQFEKDAYETFRREVKAMWTDFVSSTRKDWVEYSGDKTGRTRVDFKSGEVVVEVLIPEEEAQRDPRVVTQRLIREIERLVEDKGKQPEHVQPKKKAAKKPSPPLPEKDLSPSLAPTPVKEDLPREKPPQEKKREKAPPPSLLPAPVLEGQLKDKQGNPVKKENKKKFAKEIIETKPVSKKLLKTQKGKKIKAQVKFALVPDHLRIRAEKYLPSVRKQCRKFNISVPLAFAVIHTESYFNPKATSHAPAYGLMQLVPKSGGRDAYRYVYGQDKILSPNYLYQAHPNIELGCGYLGLLKNHYFKRVKNRDSAEYCAIAAYNTGTGNLSRAVTGSRKLNPAIARVNTMEPGELYSHLRKNLPYDETKGYLKKVSERRNLYKAWE